MMEKVKSLYLKLKSELREKYPTLGVFLYKDDCDLYISFNNADIYYDADFQSFLMDFQIKEILNSNISNLYFCLDDPSEALIEISFESWKSKVNRELCKIHYISDYYTYESPAYIITDGIKQIA